jgi:hypothetical protein
LWNDLFLPGDASFRERGRQRVNSAVPNFVSGTPLGNEGVTSLPQIGGHPRVPKIKEGPSHERKGLSGEGGVLTEGEGVLW